MDPSHNLLLLAFSQGMFSFQDYVAANLMLKCGAVFCISGVLLLHQMMILGYGSSLPAYAESLIGLVWLETF
jgi:hypothetical protein